MHLKSAWKSIKLLFTLIEKYCLQYPKIYVLGFFYLKNELRFFYAVVYFLREFEFLEQVEFMSEKKNKKEAGKSKKMNYINKLRLILGSIVIGGMIIFTFAYYIVVRNVYISRGAEQLSAYTTLSKKGFLGDTKAELNLALFFAKSSVVKNYCSDPSAENLSLMKEEAKKYETSLLSGYFFFCSDVDKRFYATDAAPYTVFPEKPDHYWYNMTLNMGVNEDYNYNINYSAELGTMNLWINIVVRDDNGRSIGMIGTGVPLSTFVSSLYEDLDPKYMMYMYNNDLEIVGAKNTELIGQHMSLYDYIDGGVAEEIQKIMENKNRSELERIRTQNGVYYVCSIPDLGWNIFTGYEPSKEIYITGTGIAVFVIITILLVVICGSIYKTFYNFRMMRDHEKVLGNKLVDEVQNLGIATKETAATAQDQSAAVKEIVATMEDSNTLSENISLKISDVASVANKTSCDVADGAIALEVNVSKLHEIFEANQQTISGIKALGDKIENIWDIVTLINSVADQAKIIAFNAELEAASAGEAGKNFHIVASEIRRLADGIIDGTKEIKERINEIQQSSDSLIIASESGTEKINEGCACAQELETRFESIRSAAEITADSAGDITSIIQQQTAASAQILITLKQIAAGVENFSSATENISTSAELLKDVAIQLNKEASAVDKDVSEE